MKKNKNIEFEIEKTLESFSEYERFEGNPFLATRINAEIDKKLESNTKTSFSFQKVLKLKPAFFILVMVLNIYTGITYFVSQSETDYSRSDEITNLMDEFTLSSDDYTIDGDIY